MSEYIPTIIDNPITTANFNLNAVLTSGEIVREGFDTYDEMKARLHQDKHIWKEITLSNSDTSLISSMQNTFIVLTLLKYLDISDTKYISSKIIYRSCFFGCTSLKKIIMPKQQIVIGDSFRCFYNIGLTNLDLTNLDYTQTTESQRQSIFEGCPYLTEVLCRTQEDADLLMDSSSKPKNVQCYVKNSNISEDFEYIDKRWRSEYIQLESIKANGGSYFNTWFKLNQDTEIHAKYKYNTTNNSVIFGCTDTPDTDNANNGIYRISGGVNRIAFGLGNNTVVGLSLYKNKIEDLKIGYNKAYINNKLIAEFPSVDTWESSFNCYVGARNGSALYPFYGDIYRYKHFQNHELILNLIPAQRRSDDAVGMLDNLTGTFYESETSTPFIAGNVIEYPTEEEIILYNEDGRCPYKQLEWLENPRKNPAATFGGGCYASLNWFDTKYIANSKTCIDVKYQNTSPTFPYNEGQTSMYFPRGGVTGYNKYEIENSFVIGNSNLANPHKNTLISNKDGYLLNHNAIETNIFQIHTTKFDFMNQTSTINGITKSWTTPFLFENYHLPIFRFFRSDEYFYAGRVYYFKISEEGIYKQIIIPVKLTDNVTANPDIPWSCDGEIGEIGMWDTVNDVFLANKGDGEFIAGVELNYSKMSRKDYLKMI